MAVDDENRLLKQKIKELQDQMTGTTSKLKSPEDYIREMKILGEPTNNQFAHQDKLLWHPQYPPKTQMELLPPDAILGTIKDSKTLLLLQNDNVLLNRFFDMGLRSEGIMDLFDSLFYGWWQGMRLTGALGGQERWFQSFETPFMMGGESFSYLEKRAMKKAGKKGKLREQIMGGIRGSGGEEGKMYE